MKNHIKIFSLFLILISNGCKEEFVPEIFDYQTALVVEATLTDNAEIQSIKLSRTSELQDENLIIEDNAYVAVESDNGEIYNFSQGEDGIYYSDRPFSAKPDIRYSLFVETEDGASYHSSGVQLPKRAELTNVYAEKTVKNGVEGIQVYADSKGSPESGSYFRYEFVETYKIVAPNFSGFEASITDDFQSGTEYKIKITRGPLDEGRICYSSNDSRGINQITTSNLSENLAEAVPIRFIPGDDPVIKERYSIEIIQYVENPEAYAFYKILKDLGEAKNIFSQTQPGTVQGNIYNQEDREELVVGYFSVAFKESKRIFFNYADFELPSPPYFFECETITYDYKDNLIASYDGDINERKYLYVALKDKEYEVIPSQTEEDLIYTIVKMECANCTSFSSKTKPEFWID